MLKKTPERPLDIKIKPVKPKRNQPWIFIGRTNAEAEASILWPFDVKSQLIGRDLDAGKDWRREERNNREWDGWMASPTQWTWVWVNFRCWWWTGRPAVLRFMGSQSQTRLSDWSELNKLQLIFIHIHEIIVYIYKLWLVKSSHILNLLISGKFSST